MKSRRPKVLHELAGRTMLGHVLAAATPLEPRARPSSSAPAASRSPRRLPEAGVTPVVQEQQTAPVTPCGSRWRRWTPRRAGRRRPRSSWCPATPRCCAPRPWPPCSTCTRNSTPPPPCSRRSWTTPPATAGSCARAPGRRGRGARRWSRSATPTPSTREIREVAIGVYAFAAGHAARRAAAADDRQRAGRAVPPGRRRPGWSATVRWCRR